MRRTLALAASLVLLLLAGAGWWQWHPRHEATVAQVAPASSLHETLTVHEEVLEDTLLATPLGPPHDAIENQGLSFIQNGCTYQPTVCNSPDFQALHTELTELQAQQAQLQQAVQRFGNSPELTREQARLVNLQAAITRQLINKLIS